MTRRKSGEATRDRQHPLGRQRMPHFRRPGPTKKVLSPPRHRRGSGQRQWKADQPPATAGTRRHAQHSRRGRVGFQPVLKRLVTQPHMLSHVEPVRGVKVLDDIPIHAVGGEPEHVEEPPSLPQL